MAMDRLIWADSGDADTFLEVVDDLICTVKKLNTEGTNRALLDCADELLEPPCSSPSRQRPRGRRLGFLRHPLIRGDYM
jgi:hypothetical protein